MYDAKNGLWVAHCQDGPLSIIGKMANRHGLVAGATGTGRQSHFRSWPRLSARQGSLASWRT